LYRREYLKEEQRLKVFENRLLGRRDEATGLDNEELHNLYSSPSIIGMVMSRKMWCVRHVARMGEKRNASRLLTGKTEIERSIRRPRRRWVDNIKMDLRVLG
jgi:hypothetical protein